MQKKGGKASAGGAATKKGGSAGAGAKKGPAAATTTKRTFSKPVNQSALCIIPPEDLWDPIQAIRAEHDKSYTRWMPHINLLFPFVPSGQFPDAVAELQSNPRFANVSRFRVRLSKLFSNDGSKYLCFLAEVVTDEAQEVGKKATRKTTKKKEPKQEDPLTQLHNILLESFPDCIEPGKEFVPHMTIGQFSQDVIEAEKNRIQENWTPIEFDVTEINLIARDSDIFKVKETITLK